MSTNTVSRERLLGAGSQHHQQQQQQQPPPSLQLNDVSQSPVSPPNNVSTASAAAAAASAHHRHSISSPLSGSQSNLATQQLNHDTMSQQIVEIEEVSKTLSSIFVENLNKKISFLVMLCNCLIHKLNILLF